MENKLKSKLKLKFIDDDDIEVGLDEAGRGCLAGPIFAAAVIWDSNKEFPLSIINDSKKLSPQQRYKLREIIEKESIDYSVSFIDNDEIDLTNITKCNMKAMYQCLDALQTKYDRILIDGSYYKPHNDIDCHTIIKGDQKIISIACASILAKTYHDDYIYKLVYEYPILNQYGWLSNQSYGTLTHRDAIKKYGVTKWHRKSYKICHNLPYFDVDNYNQQNKNKNKK